MANGLMQPRDRTLWRIVPTLFQTVHVLHVPVLIAGEGRLDHSTHTLKATTMWHTMLTVAFALVHSCSMELQSSRATRAHTAKKVMVSCTGGSKMLALIAIKGQQEQQHTHTRK